MTTLTPEWIGLWLQEMTNEHGLELPNSYLTFDLETTSLDEEEAYIIEAGHLFVDEGKRGEPHSRLLNWPGAADADFDRSKELKLWWFIQNFYKAMGEAHRDGRGFRYVEELLRKEGADPFFVIEKYREIFSRWADSGGWFVAHNGVNYDNRIWARHFLKYLGSDFRLCADRFIDTGLILKAAGISEIRGRLWLPSKYESLGSFWHRTASELQIGAKWKLSEACKDLGISVDHNLDMSMAHTAGFDCMMTHLLLETYKKLKDTNVN